MLNKIITESHIKLHPNWTINVTSADRFPYPEGFPCFSLSLTKMLG